MEGFSASLGHFSLVLVDRLLGWWVVVESARPRWSKPRGTGEVNTRGVSGRRILLSLFVSFGCSAPEFSVDESLDVAVEDALSVGRHFACSCVLDSLLWV